MGINARIDSSQNPEDSFVIGTEEALLIGRSKDCSVCLQGLEENYISRKQARIYFQDNCYVLENIGKNPIHINGKPLNGKPRKEKHHLQENDHLSFGNWEYVFHLYPEGYGLPPWIMIEFPDRKLQRYDINEDVIFIGRSDSANIRINDHSISEKHCVIRKGKDGYYIENLSDSNPLLFDNIPFQERLFRPGEIIKMGQYNISFFSAGKQSKGDPKPIWLVPVFLAIFAISSLIYWTYSENRDQEKENVAIEKISVCVEKGEYGQAREILIAFFQTNPESGNSQKIRESLRGFTKTLINKEQPSEAKKLLVSYLAKYGWSNESNEIRNLLDWCRVELGQGLVEEGKYQEALDEINLIIAASQQYEKKENLKREITEHLFGSLTTGQILENAKKHFEAKQYQKAYDGYKEVLRSKPENIEAEEQIGRIKNIYRKSGEKALKKNDYWSAYDFFRECEKIAPEDITIRDRIALCKEKLSKQPEDENRVLEVFLRAHGLSEEEIEDVKDEHHRGSRKDSK